MSTLPGLETYATGGEFPLPYIPHFLTDSEANEFLEFFSHWNYCDTANRYGAMLLRKGIAFASDPDHSQVRGTYDGTLIQTDGSELTDDHCDGPVLPSSEAPAVVRRLQQNLTAHLRTMPGYEKRTVNYLSILLYPDQDIGIDWHLHKEDHGVDTPTLIISTGAERRSFSDGRIELSRQYRTRLRYQAALPSTAHSS
jgi:hypothetical protein